MLLTGISVLMSNAMTKFAVTVHGTGCWLGEEKRWWGRWRRTVQRPMGFYTARFIEALSPEEAVEKAVAIVQEEVKDLHRPYHPWSVAADEVREDAEQFNKYAPGLGFSWYPENDSHQDSASEQT